MTAQPSLTFPNKPQNKWIWPQPFLETLRFLDKLCSRGRDKSIDIRLAAFQFGLSLPDVASFRQIKLISGCWG